MNFKRSVALMTVLVMLVAIFSGCSKGGSSDTKSGTSENESHVSADIFSKEKVTYKDAEGDSLYTIVRPAEATEDINKNASVLFGSLRKVSGTAPKNVADDVSDGKDAYEILIGDTNREESKLARDYMNENYAARKSAYFICTIGKKICIIAVGNGAYADAVSYFCDNYIKEEGVEGGILYEHEPEGNFTDIKIGNKDIKYFKIVRQHFNGSYITQLQMEDLVSKILEKTGHELEIVEDEYVEAGNYEIIVGNTNRGTKHELFDTKEGREKFFITVEGTKVWISGGSYHATAMGVSEFAKTVSSTDTIDEKNNVEGDYNTAVASYDKGKYFTPTWYDDFDGDSVDTSKWHVCDLGEYVSQGKNGKTSVRSADPKITYVRDGKFTIAASEDENYYYGGMLRTDITMNYRYGFVEYSAKIPHGDGFWVTLWAGSKEMGRILSPEIDINESFGNSLSVAANCHSWPTSIGKEMGYDHTSLDGQYSSAKRYTCPDGKVLGDDFHTYGMLWDRNKMAFTCDGKIYFSYDITKTQEDIECFNHTLYLILSMAVYFEGAPLAGNATPEQWQTTNKFITDNLYLYQLQDGASELILS